MSENLEGKLIVEEKVINICLDKKMFNISSLVIFGILSSFSFTIGILLQKMLMPVSVLRRNRYFLV